MDGGDGMGGRRGKLGLLLAWRFRAGRGGAGFGAIVSFLTYSVLRTYRHLGNQFRTSGGQAAQPGQGEAKRDARHP